MTIIASTLFLIAASLSIFAIFGTVGQSLPRILEVIENRDVTERKIRKITVGTARTLSARTLVVPPAKSRQLSIATARLTTIRKIDLPANTLPLAA